MGFELVGVRLWGNQVSVRSSGIMWDSTLVGGACVLFVCGMDDMIRLPYEDILHDDILYEI